MITNLKFYPSPSVVTYYINGLFIDDVFRVDFERKVTHQPIWGFDSQTYDFVARGKEVVSGNIIVNFRYPGYLKAAIQHSKSAIKDVNVSMQDQNRSYIQTLDPLELSERMKSLGHTFGKRVTSGKPKQNLDGTWNLEPPSRNGEASTLQEFETIKSSPGNTMIGVLKEELMKKYGSMPQEESQESAIYSSILDDEKIVPFDLVVRYGMQGISSGFVRVFKECVIIGEGQTVSANAGVGGDLSSSAQPILEIYPFFCRTIVVEKYR